MVGNVDKAAGDVVEFWGDMGAQPAHDRHDGFDEFTDKEPTSNVARQSVGRLEAGEGLRHQDHRLRKDENIDFVCGRNDPMACGAYLAAKDAEREKRIKAHRDVFAV